MRPSRVIALVAAGLVVSGGTAFAVASNDGDTHAACTSDPVVTYSEAGAEITSTCVVPMPPAVTETTTVEVPGPTETATATATATQTVTIPGPTRTVTVTASPSSSPTPTRTPTPSATPTPTPTVTPTPTPTPTVDPAPAGDWPNASNTGWQPTGVTLKTVKAGDSGAGWSAQTVGGNPVFYVTKANTVVDGLNIPMCVKVMANNVTIQRSRIACASYYTVNVSDPPTYYSGLTLTDVELDGLNGTGAGIAVMANSNATYTRLNVHGFGSSGPRMASGSTLQDSWIHDFVCVPPDHSAGSTANDGGSNIRWLRNNIDVRATTGPNQCASTAIGVDPDFGNYDGVLIQGNRVAGGAYGIYTAQNQGAKNVTVTGNTFVRGTFVYGAASQVASGNGNTFTGNVYDDGKPVN